jgi:hypothetical protein
LVVAPPTPNTKFELHHPKLLRSAVQQAADHQKPVTGMGGGRVAATARSCAQQHSTCWLTATLLLRHMALQQLWQLKFTAQDTELCATTIETHTFVHTMSK